MATYYVQYAGKELVAIDKTNSDERIISSDRIKYLFELMANEQILSASIEGRTLYINYNKDSVIIHDYVKVLKDKRYQFFRSYLNKFVTDDNIINLIKAREQIIKNMGNNHKLLKRISITGMAVGVFVFGAYATMKYLDIVDPVATDKPILSFEESGQRRLNGSDYVIENYGQEIKKYSKKFGVPAEVIQAILARNVDESAKYVGTSQFGATVNEFKEYLGQDIAVYDYDTGNSYLYHIDDDNLNYKENYVKIVCMILQYKLFKTNYNIVAAVECLHRNDDEFKYFVLKDAVEKHPEYFDNPYFVKEYFNYAMENTSDLSWLSIYDLSDGSYARKIFKYIPNGTKLEIPHKEGEATYYTVTMNIEEKKYIS